MAFAFRRDRAWQHALCVTRPALLLAPTTFLDDVQERLAAAGVITTVVDRDPAPLFAWIVALIARQGISNHAAEVFAVRRGSPTWKEVSARMTADARCPRLRSRWHFADCTYRRSTGTCGTQHHQRGCPVTMIPARKGALAEAAIGLWLFIRDVANGDLVGWIDGRLAAADPGVGDRDRAARLRTAVLVPLVNITGTGSKVWSMILAELLLGADQERERWITAGASFVAVDRLVHNCLARTGILDRHSAEHAYGAACHAPGGCVDIIAGLAARIDAREFNPSFPATFPRWVQFAIWSYCAAGEWSICNGTNIDDGMGCQQRYCPSFTCCDKMVIKPNL